MQFRTLFKCSVTALVVALAVSIQPVCAEIYRSVQPNGVVLYTNVSPAAASRLIFRETPPAAAAQQTRGGAEWRRTVQNAVLANSIQAAGHHAGVDPARILAVILAESGYDPAARSGKGAVGLMQLMPETAKRYGVSDRLDPAQNIRGGSLYLGDLMRMFGNYVRIAVAAYNAGEGAVLKYGKRIPPYPETVAYVPRVMTYYRRYRPN